MYILAILTRPYEVETCHVALVLSNPLVKSCENLFVKVQNYFYHLYILCSNLIIIQILYQRYINHKILNTVSMRRRFDVDTTLFGRKQHC